MTDSQYRYQSENRMERDNRSRVNSRRLRHFDNGTFNEGYHPDRRKVNHKRSHTRHTESWRSGDRNKTTKRGHYNCVDIKPNTRHHSSNNFWRYKPINMLKTDIAKKNNNSMNRHCSDQISNVKHRRNSPVTGTYENRSTRKRCHSPQEKCYNNLTERQEFRIPKNDEHKCSGLRNFNMRSTSPARNKFFRTNDCSNANTNWNQSFATGGETHDRLTSRSSDIERPSSSGNYHREAITLIDLMKLDEMDDDNLAFNVRLNKVAFYNMLKTAKRHKDIALILNVLGRICSASGDSFIEETLMVVKNQCLLDRPDVKETIYNLRSCKDGTLSVKELTTLKMIISLIKGLTEYVKCGPADLFQTLDSLEFGALEFISDEEERKGIISTVSSIRELWKANKANNPETKSSLSILPNLQEIESFQHSDVSEKYESADDYIQRLFLVHRQDFVRPLCKGLLRLRADLEKDFTCIDRRWLNDDVRVYPCVQLLSRCCNLQNGVTLRIKFDVTLYRKVNWASRKLLTHGSLVCLSNRAFSFLVYAMVTERQPKDLQMGILEIKCISMEDEIEVLGQNDMILIESQAFFPSYYHTLQSLKGMHSNILRGKGDLPFCRQLVNLKDIDEKPKFFNTDLYNTTKCYISGSIGIIDITNSKEWPSPGSFKMDDFQHAAFFSSINRSLAIIQGPPGTGKTVVGLKIAELLLNNEKIWHTEEKNTGPMLLLSYTNHALDQFIVEIEKRLVGSRDKDIVRLGSRSDVESLQKFNLTTHRKNRYTYTSSEYYHPRDGHYIRRKSREVANIHNVNASEAKAELSIRIKTHTDLKRMREHLLTEIVDLNWLHEIAQVVHLDHFQSIIQEGGLLRWLDLLSIVKSGMFQSFQRSTGFEDDDFLYADLENNQRGYLYDETDEGDLLAIFYTGRLKRNLDIRFLQMLISENQHLMLSDHGKGFNILCKLSNQNRTSILQTIQNKLSLQDQWKMTAVYIKFGI